MSGGGTWTTPRTWVAGELVTAAIGNTHWRDNLNALTPAASTITTTGTQTALAIPTGRGDLVIFANNASTLTLQGIAAGEDGQHLAIYSIGAGDVELANQNASASAANRIVTRTGGTITLTAGVGTALLVYDATASRWRVLTTNYSSGNWTPVIGGSTSTSGQSYTSQVGRWSKYGKTVHVQAYVELSSAGTITGDVQIQGLPFAAIADSNAYCGIAIGQAHNLAGSGVVAVTGWVAPSGTAIALVKRTAQSTTVSVLAAADIGNTTNFIVGGSYLAST